MWYTTFVVQYTAFVGQYTTSVDESIYHCKYAVYYTTNAVSSVFPILFKEDLHNPRSNEPISANVLQQFTAFSHTKIERLEKFHHFDFDIW